MDIKCKSIVPAERNILKEKNDCTVRAVSHAMEIPYLEAYGLMLGFGRKRNRGLHIEEVYSSLGFTEFPRPNMTVENYVKFIANTGNWIISVRGHVFAVINGTILDTYPKSNLTRYVLQAWKVK